MADFRARPAARRRSNADSVTRHPDPVLRILDDPVTALLPWFAFNFLLEPLSFLGASLIAFALSVMLVAVTRLRGQAPRAFEVSDAILFAAIVGVGLLRDPGSQSWLSIHADTVSNVALTVVAFASVAVGWPFTAPYTQLRFANLDECLLNRLDRASTLIWAAALLFASVVAIYGEWVLDQQTNLWTAWILQTVPLIVAFDLTLWLDQRTLASASGAPEAAPPPLALARDLLAWLVPIGALSLLFGSAPPMFGWALIAIGLAGASSAWLGLRRMQSGRRAIPEAL